VLNPSYSAVGVPAGAATIPPEDPVRALNGLVRGVARRDRAAFAALYDLLSGEIGVQVNAQLDNPRQRATVAHATFVELWRLAPAHAACPDARAWVHAIVAARIQEVLRCNEVLGPDPWWADFEAVHESCRRQQFQALANCLV
jgi:DNA-directed RNA polymerase specialized sigma24 family protein